MTAAEPAPPSAQVDQRIRWAVSRGAGMMMTASRWAISFLVSGIWPAAERHDPGRALA